MWNPLWKCVSAEARGSYVIVVERNRLTGRYRQRSVETE